MARVRSLVRGLVSSYALLGATVAYGLATVPLALYHLSKEEFGLWSMVMQFVTYLAMLDLGMSSSVSRLLIDHKDDSDNEAYGSLLTTGGVVLFCQGAFIFSLGYLLAPWFASISRLPEPLLAPFVTLLRTQCLIAAIGLPARIFTHVLYAHQRVDVVNITQISVFVGGVGFMWLGFYMGAGVYSILWSSWLGLVQTVGLTSYAACKLKLLPRGGLRAFHLTQVEEMFRYGRDVFLVAAGTQMMVASQPIILSRTFGLDAVATWSVGTRIFGLVNQLVWKLADMSAPGFAEMIVRGERAQLEHRYRQVAIVTASFAGWAAVTLCQVNTHFISVWTGNAISWLSTNDLLLALWMVSLALVHCHNGFVLITKEIGGMRWIYFLEGASFVLLALLMSPLAKDGIAMLLQLSVITSIGCSGAYGIWRIACYFKLSLWEVAVIWLIPMSQVVVVYGGASLLLWNILSTQSTLVRFVAHLSFGLTFGALILAWLGVPRQLREESLRRLRTVVPSWATGASR